MLDQRVNRLEARLRAAGIRPTRQRLDVARVLFERHQHLSADQVLARVRELTRRNISKATVYNTLAVFSRAGLLREVYADPSRVFYDTNLSEHHHLYDLDSGALTDLEPGHVQVGSLPRLPEHLELAGVEVIVRVRQRTG